MELDKIFGEKNFVNEIIWHYKTYQGRVKNSFPKKHDTILVYSKSKKYIFKLGYKENYKETVNYNRWKSFINKDLEIIFGKHPKTDSRFSAYLRRWIKENNRAPKEGDVIYKQTGEVIDDVFQIQAIDPKDKTERLGYPTQKPLELLDRLVTSFTNKGDMVFDAFCGCGTTISSAQNLGRRWLGCDISKDAISVIRKRMSKEHQLKIKVIPTGSLSKSQIMRLDPFEFERHVVGLIGEPNLKQVGDGGVDGYTYNHIPIQVKKSYKAGRPVLDSFYKHIEKRGAGIIIAHSFSRDLIEEKKPA